MKTIYHLDKKSREELLSLLEERLQDNLWESNKAVLENMSVESLRVCHVMLNTYK